MDFQKERRGINRMRWAVSAFLLAALIFYIAEPAAPGLWQIALICAGIAFVGSLTSESHMEGYVKGYQAGRNEERFLAFTQGPDAPNPSAASGEQR